MIMCSTRSLKRNERPMVTSIRLRVYIISPMSRDRCQSCAPVCSNAVRAFSGGRLEADNQLSGYKAFSCAWPDTGRLIIPTVITIMTVPNKRALATSVHLQEEAGSMAELTRHARSTCAPNRVRQIWVANSAIDCLLSRSLDITIRYLVEKSRFCGNDNEFGGATTVAPASKATLGWWRGWWVGRALCTHDDAAGLAEVPLFALAHCDEVDEGEDRVG